MWYELDGEKEELLYQEKSFGSLEASVEYLRERIATGLVYDLIGSIETVLGAEETGPEIEMTPDTGFYPVKKREVKNDS